jgi:drug/metabolite transporter (DMT)-like permease
MSERNEAAAGGGDDTAAATGPVGPRLAVVGAALLFSTGGAAIKATSFDAWQVTAFRCVIAAVALTILVPGAHRYLSRRTALVGVAYAATMILYVAANKYTTAANAIFLQSTAPLYILLLSPRLLGERVHRSDLAWMALIGVGLAAFFVGDQQPFATAPRPALGNALGAVSGATWALTILGLRWVGSRPTPSTKPGGPGAAAAIAGNSLAFLVCIPLALPVVHATAVDWLAVGHLGIFQIGVAYALLTRGIERVSALEASLLLLLEPAASPLWAWLLHDEVPGGWAVAGGALILLATVGKAITAEARRRRRRRTA